MKSFRLLFLLLALLPPLAGADGPLTKGNFLVSVNKFTGSVDAPKYLAEYNVNGQKVSDLGLAPHWLGPIGYRDQIRDLVQTSETEIYLYDGTFEPRLSKLNLATGTWTQETYPGWSTVNNGTYGGIGWLEDYVFVTDMVTYGGGQLPTGILRFDRVSGTVTRFASNIEPSDVNVGLDGLLYVIDGAGSPTNVIYRFDPITLSPLGTIPVIRDDHRSVCADTDGSIFTATWGGEIHHYSAAGVLLGSRQVSDPGSFLGHTYQLIPGFTDIDIDPAGRLVLGTNHGAVIVTDRELVSHQRIDLEQIGSTVFVTWVTQGSDAPTGGSNIGTQSVVASGAPVPHTGEFGSGIPAEAYWTSFNLPAVNDAGELAFVGKWKAPSERGTGVFAGAVPALKLAVGQTLAQIPEATISKLHDPVIAPDGGIALLAVLKGEGVTRANDVVALHIATGGQVSVIAREGELCPGASGAVLQRLTGISVQTDSVVVLGNLVVQATEPVVTLNNDAVAIAWSPGGGAQLLIRDGQSIGGQQIAKFTTLNAPVGGLVGSRYWHTTDSGGTRLSAQLLFTDGTRSEAVFSTQQAPAVFGSLGLVGQKIGAPSLSADGQTVCYLSKAPGDRQRLYQRDLATESTTLLVSEGAAITNLGAVQLGTFADPFANRNQTQIGFLGKLTGTTVIPASNQALFTLSTPDAPMLIARKGAQAAGCPTGVFWKSFSAFAFHGTGRKAIFSGSLSSHVTGFVTKANNTALWTVDVSGQSQMLFRKGDIIQGGTLTDFTAFKNVPTVAGTLRCLSSNGNLAWRGSFAGQQRVLFLTRLP